MSRFPDQPPASPAIPPMVYVKENAVWEYKRVMHDLQDDQLPEEQELNEFGKDGWELVSIVNLPGRIYLYFKRMKS
jgi:hypothetical protein